ncbi:MULTISPECIES: hypothetical protein [unclassified Marinobacterium]|uniref:hypothetical protein n=1 Tax=unclassified Marinobacterium TaxID=2644139 RepID=UPI001569E9AD|nr:MULTISPECIES: hypothetical protein [unclassified Marinobacterium]NRP46429.1 hypothetical protein [Marinobacterium sp. xm-d-543]NRP56194.1 hypothetical protein [Marinobacterium sp. xm-d-510]NRP97017.1 hypothetical protein [Marinobacterium sp. xm-a-127]NRQ22778.1 hypothetical protein [Marinobacterium sp. xm-m-312]
MARTAQIVTLIMALALSGCVGVQNKELRLQNLAKSDVDMIVDQHIKTINAMSRELTIKLYKRNPRELKKAAAGTTVETRLKQLLSYPRPISHRELNHLYGVDALKLAFDEEYQGDRVFALMVAITGMVHASYNYREEFFMLNEIDSQKLYNSARNLEKIAWQLHNFKTSSGELFILTDSMNEGVINLSYERLFGKMIATQDMLAEIVAQTTDRTINRIVLSVATAPFLPI